MLENKRDGKGHITSPAYSIDFSNSSGQACFSQLKRLMCPWSSNSTSRQGYGVLQSLPWHW